MTLFQENLFVLDTPIFCWEVIKRLTAYQLHGSFTLAWFSHNRPHCLRRLHAGLVITLGLWLDGSIIVPITCHCRIGNYPMVIDYCFSLPAAQIVAQYLTWLMLITIAMGMYLMNGYSVVKEQPIHRYVKRKTGKGLSVVLHLFPHLKAKL